jgi:hypothetical protein
MGASTFTTYAAGADAATAFLAACAEVRYERGHGGYTGTIAEKDSYTVVAAKAMTHEEASEYAASLMDRDDPRIADKWGPAGAIPVIQVTRTATVDNVPEPGRGRLSPDDLARLTPIARQQQVITERETVAGGWWTYPDGAEITVDRDPAVVAAQTTPDGWLFFGWASS